jgi:hypothetical protein
LTGCVPEQGRDVEVPEYVSRPAENLIKKILVREQNLRIGVGEIEEHIWFNNAQNIPEIRRFMLEIKSLNCGEMMRNMEEVNCGIQEKIKRIMERSKKK